MATHVPRRLSRRRLHVYHSLEQAQSDAGIATRWLDLRGLLGSYLHVVGGGVELGQVRFFTAYAHHLAESNPGLIGRHQTYIDALRATQVQVELGRFKKVKRRCSSCGRRTPAREEKETDVALGVHLIERCISEEAEAVVLVTGDSDQAPAIRMAKQLRPSVRILCAFPYKRKSEDLAREAHKSFSLSKEAYAQHQLPQQLEALDGSLLVKPERW